MHKPLVIVPCCNKEIGKHPYFAVQVKYVESVLIGAGCMPVILPSVGDMVDLDTIMAVADGVMLTGSPSNVHPSHFGQEVRNPALPLDQRRDATTLPLIRAVLARGIPLLAICRGTQEINVALGGSLHQAVQEVPGMMDHRDDDEEPLDVQYGPAHAVKIEAGGVLQEILGVGEIMVNSLHGQGVDRLAEGLRVEARADDGLIEAFSVKGAKNFNLALQWHPEWRIAENPDSMKMFGAFGDACRRYQALKGGAHG
ncbi:MAG: gamma-glutamyl-gamma-aminobutyrate hydrolase family protein [Burkholderiaceae bacterium]|nr:gamma-glutamyl-gamma-aminobutyrate hydrolase family protein [Burkholderiaceae bacterium]